MRGEFLDITRDTAKETRDYNKILNFDWNQGVGSPGNEESKEPVQQLTVEEMLLLRLTNDRAEYANPQVAHVAFTEFKKFMFLNKHFITQEIKRKEAAVKEGDPPYTREFYYVGLFAPPTIDAIWSSLISMDALNGKYSSIRSIHISSF